MDQPDARFLSIVNSGFENLHLFKDDLIRHLGHRLNLAGQTQDFVSVKAACPLPWGALTACSV